MTGRTDLFGEIPKDEIVKIAEEAAKKRGYAVYKDFDKYMGQLIDQGRLKPTRGGRYQHLIWAILKEAKWKRHTEYRPTRLYPPGTEPPENQLTLLNGEEEMNRKSTQLSQGA